MNTLLETTRKSLEKNGIATEYCKTKAELIPLLQNLLLLQMAAVQPLQNVVFLNGYKISQITNLLIEIILH